MIPGWLDEIEREVLGCLRGRGSLSVRELAEALGVSEPCASSQVILLVSARRLAIERVSLPVEARARTEARQAACAAPRRRAGTELATRTPHQGGTPSPCHAELMARAS
jgi:Winged helix-turn-helix DNA-binding